MPMTNKTLTGIIFGLDKELRLYRNRVRCVSAQKVAGIEFIEGELAGARVLLANGGIGKVNASIAATLMCDRFGCDLIIFSGLAGGLAPGLEAGDLVHLTQPCPPPGLPRPGNGFQLSDDVEQIARGVARELEKALADRSIQIHFGR